MSAKEIAQMAFKVSTVESAFLMFSTDGSVAILVMVDIDAIIDCVAFRETASAALCHFPGPYWMVKWYWKQFSFNLSILRLTIVLKSQWLKRFSRALWSVMTIRFLQPKINILAVFIPQAMAKAFPSVDA